MHFEYTSYDADGRVRLLLRDLQGTTNIILARDRHVIQYPCLWTGSTADAMVARNVGDLQPASALMELLAELVSGRLLLSRKKINSHRGH